MVRWTWWDWGLSLGLLLPSVLWHCWLGHLTRKNPSLIWPICVQWDVKPYSISQSINHGWTGGRLSQMLEWGTLMQIVPEIFFKKRPLKILKNTTYQAKNSFFFLWRGFPDRSCCGPQSSSPTKPPRAFQPDLRLRLRPTAPSPWACRESWILTGLLVALY